MAEGWIKIHRQLFDHWLWDNKPKTKFEAWLWILQRANHSDNKYLLGNEVINGVRGEFITSEKKLMKEFKWSKTKVRNFLQTLKKESMIEIKSDTKKTTLKIHHYDFYQDKETTKKPEKNFKKTGKELQKDTNKNGKNLKNVENEKKKEITYTSEFENCWSIYPKRNGAKVGKNPASIKFEQLHIDDKRRCYRGVSNYSDYCINADQFPKDFTVFLNQRIFDDFQEKINNVNHSNEDKEFQKLLDTMD